MSRKVYVPCCECDESGMKVNEIVDELRILRNGESFLLEEYGVV